MEFEWDDSKAATNLSKHSVDFFDAAHVFEDEMRIEKFDGSEPYREDRFITIGLFDGNELAVVYTFREDTVRIISARKAGLNERRNYWENR